MLTTLLSLYATTLLGNNSPATPMHVMPWNNSALLEATSLPEKKFNNIAPVIKAKAAIAVDLENGLILYEKNIHEPLPIASLTKLMTAVITLEENNIKDVVTVSKNAAVTPGSKIWLAPGEKISVENLLYSILIHSANDAAVALAEHNADTVENFVTKMNQKSKELGLTSTYFLNPTGLDQSAPEKEGGDINNTETSNNNGMLPNNNGTTEKKSQSQVLSNSSTAYDLTLLGRYAFGKSLIRRAVAKKELEVSSTNEKLLHKLANTNELLGSYLKVLGLKTGTTDEAGECLISIIQNDDGHAIVTVVLKSPSRYNETKVLADWVFRSYVWK